MPKHRSAAREVRTIAQALSTIAGALGRLAPLLEQRPSSAAEQPRRKLRLSAERRALLKLQGAYMGHIRGLKPRQKSRVKALRAAKGYAPAVALAKKLAGG